MDYLLFLPFIYAIVVSLILMFYFRIKYTIPDYSRCYGCVLRSICTKIGIGKLIPPSRVSYRVSKSFTIACILALGRYIVIAIVYLYLYEFSIPNYPWMLIASGSLLGSLIYSILIYT